MPRRRTVDPAAPDPLENLELDLDPAPPRRPRGRPRKDGSPPSPTRSTAARSTAALRASVQAELHMWLEMMAGAWAVRDPVCAAIATQPVRIPTAKGVVELDRTEAIAQRLTSIVARYPKVLKKLSDTGTLGDFLMLGHLVWPIAAVVMAHHGPGGHGHDQADEDLTSYPAYAG